MPQVLALTQPDQFERYADFGAQVYQGNPCWAPPHREHLLDELHRRVPQAEYSDIQPFWIERDGAVAAVATAVIDRLYNEHWNEQVGHILLFEALPRRDEEAAELLRAVCGWFRDRGCRAARLGYLPGWQLPLTIDACDQVPTCFHGFNPPYYHNYVKNAGFYTERGCVEYRTQFTIELAAGYHDIVRRARHAGVLFRPWDFSRLESETTLFTTLTNDTFAGHWGMPPFPEPVLSTLTIGLRDALVPEFCWFAEVAGEPAGFVYSLPDLNQPEGGHGVLLIIGVREAYRGRGVNLGLAASSYLAMIDRGYRSASYTIVLDDNWPSRRTAEKLGCRIERNFVIYRRDLR